MNEISRRNVLRAGAGLGAAAGATLLMGAESASAGYLTLARGDRGSAVVKLQRLLSTNTFWCGSWDGIFGYNVQQAVMAAQKAYRLPRTGVATDQVWYHLYRGRKPAVATEPSWMTASLNIHVQLTNQLVIVARDGRPWLTVNASSGNGEYYKFQGRTVRAVTPKGHGKVYFTDYDGNQPSRNGWREGELGSMYRPGFFMTNIAIHGSLSVPAYPASHGCVRVSAGAMDKLWDSGSMKMGRRVWVY